MQARIVSSGVFVNCPTCTRERNPCRWASRRIRSVCSSVNAPRSQKTSTYCASFCRATFGKTSAHSSSTYSSGFSLNSGGGTCAPRNVATTVPCHCCGRAPNRLQALDLRGRIQPVAGLRLKRRRSLRLRLPQRRVHMVRQRRFAGRPHAVQARANSAARLRNLLVARARQTLFKVDQPRRHKHRMRMRIHKARQHHLAAAIQLNHLGAMLPQPRIAQHLARLAHGHNLPAAISTAASSITPISRICRPRRGPARGWPASPSVPSIVTS